MDCSPPGSSVHGVFQAGALEWGAKKKLLIYVPRQLYHFPFPPAMDGMIQFLHLPPTVHPEGISGGKIQDEAFCALDRKGPWIVTKAVAQASLVTQGIR